MSENTNFSRLINNIFIPNCLFLWQLVLLGGGGMGNVRSLKYLYVNINIIMNVITKKLVLVLLQTSFRVATPLLRLRPN